MASIKRSSSSWRALSRRPAVPFRWTTPQHVERKIGESAHDSWHSLAKSELAVLSSQCLDWRIYDQPTLKRKVDAWQECRNSETGAP